MTKEAKARKRKDKRDLNEKIKDPKNSKIFALEPIQTLSPIVQNGVVVDKQNNVDQNNKKDAVPKAPEKGKNKTLKKGPNKYESANERAKDKAKKKEKEKEAKEKKKERNGNSPAMVLGDVNKTDQSSVRVFTKFCNDFDMVQFRKNLCGTNFIPQLKQFVYLMENNPNLVSEYLENCGQPMELAQALEHIQKDDLERVSYICQILEAVILETITKYATSRESAINACRYLLKEQHSIMENLLESKHIEHRRIALKLFKALIQVCPQVGRTILESFKIFSDVHKIGALFSHTKLELHVEEAIRKIYIQFVLTFLVGKNSILVQALLNRRTVIQAIILDLIYDEHTTVCLVLNAFQNYILENGSISKTTKMNIFDLECCKHLVRLYDWLGPQGLVLKYDVEIDEGISQMQLCVYVSPEEKETVVSAVHEFNLILFGSNEYGINSNTANATCPWQKQYALHGKILNSILKPWLCERKADLIHTLLIINPEFSRQTIHHYSNIIKKHNAGDDGEFNHIGDFLIDLITICHPDLLHNILKEVTLAEISQWIKDICLPLKILANLRCSNMLLHPNIEYRLTTHRLLLTMFTQYSNYMIAVMQRFNTINGNTNNNNNNNLRRFKCDLYNHILMNFPSVDHILQSLNITMGSSSTQNIGIVTTHLNVTLDLILIICKYNRSIVNMTGTLLDYLKLIRPLYAGEEDVDDIVKRNSIWSNIHDIKLELKAIKTILLLNPCALNSHQELFSNVLRSFVKILVFGNDDLQRESGNLLRDIFKSAGISDTSSLEIDLWLEVLRWSDPVTVEIVTKVLTRVLKVDLSDIDLPIDSNTNTNNSFTMSKLLPLVLKSIRNVKPLDDYIEKIVVILFHYHPNPAYVIKLIGTKRKSLFVYMKAWTNTTNSNPQELKDMLLPKLCETIPFLKELQIAILKDFKTSSFDAIFGCKTESSFEMNINGKTYKLQSVINNERLLMIYIQQVLFIIIQLWRKKQLTRKQAEFGADCVNHFLAIIQELEEKNNTNDITYMEGTADTAGTFGTLGPSYTVGKQNKEGTESTEVLVNQSSLARILTYMYNIRFDCLGDSDMSSAQSEHSLHFIYFITLITEYCNKIFEYFNYSKNFRLKIVKAISISMKTVHLTKTQRNLDFFKMIDTIQLSPENCLELLELLYTNLKCNDFFIQTDDNNLFEPSFYYQLLIYLFKYLTELRKEFQSENIVRSLVKYFVNFAKKLNGILNFEDFGESFYDFLCNKQQYIPNLDIKIFASIFSGNKIRKSNVEYACLLLQRNNNLNDQFISLLYENNGKNELIYSLLEIWLNKNYNIDKSLQYYLYNEYAKGLLESIEEPRNANAIYKEHVACSVKLINICIPVAECIRFCKKQLHFYDACETHQIRLIYAIYEKAWKGTNKKDIYECSDLFLNYINLQVQMLSNDLHYRSLTVDKLQLFAFQMFSWITKLRKLSAAVYYGFEDIVKNENWANLFNGCLKHCMQITDTTTDIATDKNITQNNTKDSDTENGLLLKFLAYLCDKLFIDYENVAFSKYYQPQEPVRLFRKTCEHPEFNKILFSTKSTQVKTAVLSLLFTLARKNPISTLIYLEIPILLNAYCASFSDSNRYILGLLHLYELHYPEEFQKHQPFLWNKKAISFQDPNSRQDENNSNRALT